ncbi:Crp/Fnr family transcriptional regulator [Listeria aquatica]|uniref:Crp/Fnr family transcriptional regulator n=1 Tax=Listeria aquatica TaxID=1494960 RepID=UPI003F6FD184
MYMTKERKKMYSADTILALCKQDPEFHKYAKTIYFKKNQKIFDLTDSNGKIFFLITGILMLTVRFDESGENEIILNFVKENQLFAKDLFSQIYPSTSEVKALSDGACWAIDRYFFDRILTEYDVKEQFIIHELLGLSRDTFSHLRKSTTSKEERVRMCIKQIGEQLGTVGENGEIVLPAAITQPIIASFSTATREFVALIIKKLTCEGILQVRPKPWIILDVDRL